MQIKITVRGGRLTKWKGQVASYAPGLVAIMVAANAAPALAFDSTYLLTSVPPSVTSATLVDGVNTAGTGDLEAVITGGTITKSATAGAGSIASGVESNSITASVTSNTATKALDTGINNATGGASNTILASAMTNATNDAFAAITSAQITNAADLTTGSSATLSDNTMSASVALSSAKFTLQGDVAVGYSNTDAGAVNVDTTTGATASLLIQSTQTASDVQNVTASNPTGLTYNTAFASITGSDIDLTVNDTATDNNQTASVTLDGNTLSASFTGNSVTNGIDVQSDGMPTLTGTAGISSLQTASEIGIDDTVPATPVVINSAVIAADSGVGVTVAGNLLSSSVNVTTNALTAAATGNTAGNTLVLESGMSLAGQSDYNSLSTSLAATDVEVDAADLFVSNVQKAADSNFAAVVNGADGIAVTANGTLTSASLATTDNLLDATTKANTMTNTLRVEDANSLSGIISNTNAQTFTDSAADNVLTTASATVTGATLSMTAGTTADKTITTSSVDLSSNDVLAAASANSATQQTVLSGNILTAGQIEADVVAGDAATTSLNATSATVGLESGFASGNLQITQGDSASALPVVSASIGGDGSTITLTAGNATSAVTNSGISVDANTLSASAVADTSTQIMSVDANLLSASVAMGNLQKLTGGVLAQNTASGVSLATTGAASGSTLSVDSNLIASGATGNLATNATYVTAETLDVLAAAIAADADTARTVLSSDLGVANTITGTAAVSLLNNQSTAPSSTSAIVSSISGAAVSDTLSTGTLTASSTTLSADMNQTTSMARANIATNVLSLDLGNVDMADAFFESDQASSPVATAGGTNLAVLGSAQENTSAVTSQIDASGTASSVTASMASGEGAVSGSSVSADTNRVTSLASGNSVTNQFNLSATNLITTESADLTPTLTFATAQAASGGDPAIPSLSAVSAAIVVGNEQVNSGVISSTIGASNLSNVIEASILGERDITATSVSADSNRLLAQAVAASGSTNTATIDATNIATSTLVGSTQTNTAAGDLTASVGDGTGSVKVLASLGSTSTASTTSLDASSNLIGATATALTDQTTLRLGGTGTATLAGTAIGAANNATTLSATTLTQAADYALGQRQTNAGDATATVTNASVEALAGTFTSGSITADANVLAAQSSGIQGSTLLSAQATELGSSASGQSSPSMALASWQANSGAITGTLDNAAVSITSGSLGTSATSETLSLSRNSLAATASGVAGSNQLTTIADAGAGGQIGMNLVTATENGVTEGNIVADRALISDQSNSAAITASVSTTPQLLASVTGTASGATIAMASNSILGTATGIDGVNQLTNTARAANLASAALAVSQYGTAAVAATVTQPEVNLQVAGAVDASSLTQEANTINATAKGMTLTNRLVTSGGSIDTLAGGATTSTTTLGATGDTTVAKGSAVLIAQQEQTANVTASLADTADTGGAEPAITLAVTGAVSNSTLGINANQLGAVASLAEATNVLASLSDTSVDYGTGSGGMALVSSQEGSGAGTARIDGVDLGIDAAAVSASGLSVDGNNVLATASGLTATNRTALSATTALTGAGGDIGSTADAVSLSGASTLANRQNQTGSMLSVIDPLADSAGGMSIALTGAATSDTSLSVSSNLMRAQATGVSANNLSTVEAGSLANAVAALSNDQSMTGAAEAKLYNPAFAVSGSAVSGTVDVSGNRAIAAATAASASNTLSVVSDTLIDGSIAGAVTLTTDATGNFDSAGAPVAALLNRQASTGVVKSTIDGETTDSAQVALTGAMNGSLAVDSNMLVAQSRGNYADSTVAVSAGSTIAAGTEAVLASNQSRSVGAISALVNGGAGATLGATLASASGSLSVDNNLVRASGAANIAVNAMTITGGFSGSASTSGAVPTEAPAIATTAQFAVLNGQQNGSDVSAKVTDYAIVSNTSGAVAGSSTLNGNMLMADATGNSSISTLRLAAAGNGTIAPIGMVSSQSNTGSLSAVVSNASFSATSGGTTGSSSLSGNAITASTTGNSSNSSVGAPDSVFTSF